MSKNARRALSILGATCFVSMMNATYATEPVVITQQKAIQGGITPGDTPGFPATLSRRGSYRLGSNLRVSDPSTHVIQVTVDSVTIDLQGFLISGPGASGTGAGISAHGVPNVTITNGTIRGVGHYGILAGAGATVTNMHLDGNRAGGLFLTDGRAGIVRDNTVTANRGNGMRILVSGAVVTGNSVNGNTDHGMFIGGGAVITGNTALNNGTVGIFAANGSVVLGNTARDNQGLGMLLDSDVGYEDNVLTNNNLDSANPQLEGGVALGPNLCGTRTTCP